jgi:hypothetical protein
MRYIHMAVWVASWMFVCSFLSMFAELWSILIISCLKFVRKLYFILPVTWVELRETGIFFVSLNDAANDVY